MFNNTLFLPIRNIRQCKFTIHKVWNSKRNYSLSIDEARERLKPLGEGKVKLFLEDDIGLARIVIDQNERKNAMSGNMMVQLEEAINKLEKWENGKALILEAAGDTFCSGGDLSILKKDKEFSTLMSTFMHNTLLRLRCLPMLSVTLVHGKAIGGGAELTASTDYRIFSPKGEVLFIHAIMGLVPGWGGTTLLNLTLGQKRILDILLSCKKLTPSYALEIGYADSIVTEEAQRAEFTRNWILEKVQNHNVIKEVKLAVFGAQRKYLEESLQNEQISFRKLWGGPLHIEALNKKIKHK